MDPDRVIDAGPIVLRPWRADDAASLQRHADDPAIAAWLADRFPSPYTHEDAVAFLASEHDTAGEWRLAITRDGLAIGGIGVRPGVDIHRHGAELGYWLGRAFHRRGYMTAAIGAFVPAAMARHRLHRIYARVFDGNVASLRLLERCGFAREGVLRRDVMKAGRLLDAILFAKTRERLDETP